MPVDAGSAVLDIIPGLDGFARRLQAGVDPVLRRVTGNVKVDADTSLFRRHVERDVDRSSRHIETRMGGAFRSVFSLAAGLGAGLATVSFFKGAFDEAEEARKTLAQTNAVLKSTGGQAGVTASDLDKLATRLSNLTAIDDEAIASTNNLLLTFTNIRNEAGKGNDIFDQTALAVQDMSVALGQDGKSSAIQLGKALNDPIKGITALQRVGVAFTDQQREQIRTLVESGHTLDAQKIILAEINKEFGGSAAAAASPLKRLGVAFNNIKEQVGTAFLPVMQRAATWLADHLPNIIARVGGDLGKVKDFLSTTFGGIKGFIDDFTAGASGEGLTENLGSGWSRFFAKIGEGARTVVDWFRANWPAIRETVVTVAGAIVAWVEANWPKIRDVFVSVGQTVGAAVETIRAVIERVVAVVSDLWDRFGQNLLQHWQTAFNTVVQTLTGILDIIRGIFNVFAGIFTGDWSRAWEGVKQIFSGAWNVMTGLVQTAMNAISTAIGGTMALISAGWSLAWNGIKTLLSDVWEGLKRIVASGIRTVVDFFLAGVEAIIKGGARMFGWVPIVGDKLREAAAGFERFRDQVNASLGGIEDQTVRVNVSPYASDAEVKASTGTAARTRYALGGNVSGPGGIDNVPAWLTAGEWVMPTDAVRHYGPAFMEAVQAKKFADGGLVGFDYSLPAIAPWMAAVNDILDKKARDAAEAFAKTFPWHWPEGPAPGGGGGPAGPGAGRGGLTAEATRLLDAVLARFPGQRFTSGYRSPAQNAAVGGAPNSDHMYGRAIDIAPGSDAVAAFGRSWPTIKQVLWQVAGHYDHVHLATQFHQGGLVPGRPGEEMLAVLEGGEHVTPANEVGTGGPDALARAIARELGVLLRQLPPPVLDHDTMRRHQTRASLAYR